MSERFRKHARLAAGIAAVFALGIALGAGLGGWLADRDTPTAVVALRDATPSRKPGGPQVQSPDDRSYSVSVRAYRPPRRSSAPVPLETSDSATPAPETVVVPKTTPPPATGFRPEALSKTTLSRTPQDAAPATPRPDIRPKTTTAPPLVIPPRAAPETDAPQLAWLANARPTPDDRGGPVIAIVMDDLGIDQPRTRRTIALPAPLTLAFIPYGRNLRQLAASGEAAGHELIIHMNMEPTDRDVDPGPNALLTSLDAGEIGRRLDWALSRFDGYIGISNHMGSRFTEWPEGMEIVLEILKRRGLLFFDSVTSTRSVGAALARAHRVATASRDIFIDNDRRPEFVARQLAKAERLARRRGYAIAIGHPHDVTIEVLSRWIPKAAEHGFTLVPLSTIVRRRLAAG